MTTKTLSKPGRPIKVHRTSWGDQIPGLTRLKDGRWRVLGGEQITFAEPDERLAVARFRQIRAARGPSNLGKLKMHPDAMSAFQDMIGRVKANGGGLRTWIERAPDGRGVALADETLSADQWAWLRGQLLERPRWVAQRVGIEWVAYGPELKRPAASARLSALIDTYAAKSQLSPNELSRSKLFWKQFVKAVGVERIDEVGHEQVVAYERAICAGGLAPKSVHHRFSKVRTVVAYAMNRGVDIQGCRQALDALAMLEVKGAHPIDPQPIAVADFWKIHAQAVTAGEPLFATIMLVALNCCAYGGEVASMKWPEVDLKARTYVGRRPKTGTNRVAVLWPEVVEGLRRIERRGEVEFIFHSARRSFTSNAVLKLWRKYRAAARLGDDVTFGRIRDAAYSVACQSASFDQAKVLAGHAFGGASDFYIRRNPQFVGTACEALRQSFDVASHVRRRR